MRQIGEVLLGGDLLVVGASGNPFDGPAHPLTASHHSSRLLDPSSN